MQALPILTSAQTRVQLQGHEHALARAHTHKHTRLHADRHSRRAHTQACTSAQIQMQTHTCAHTCKLIGVHAHTHARVRADRHGAYTHTYHNDPQTHLPPATCAPATHRHTRTRACIHPIIHTRTHVYTLGSEASHTGMQTHARNMRARAHAAPTNAHARAHRQTCTRCTHPATHPRSQLQRQARCSHAHARTLSQFAKHSRPADAHGHTCMQYLLILSPA